MRVAVLPDPTVRLPAPSDIPVISTKSVGFGPRLVTINISVPDSIFVPGATLCISTVPSAATSEYALSTVTL